MKSAMQTDHMKEELLWATKKRLSCHLIEFTPSWWIEWIFLRGIRVIALGKYVC